ncbi:MAG: S41 family peptidase [Pseudomonadota bacterium]
MKSVAMAIAMACLAPVSAFADPFDLTRTDKTLVLDAVISHLETDYVEPGAGAAAADQLRNDIAQGVFEPIDDADAFATRLSDALQTYTDDGHLNVEYVATPLAEDDPRDEAFSEEQMELWYGRHLNFGVERAEHLDGNIGYLDLRVFAPIDMGGETIVAALTMLANTDALIIDLRKNGGGIGDTADLVASYLFDGGRQPLTGVYDRPSDTLTQRHTQAYVPGTRFGGEKPVYVLLSSKTFSAAEALAYNLQALDRATLVGETSGGGAHPFEYLRVHPHFVLWSVTAKSIHPITGTNWQSVGVKPDIETEAGAALQAALDDLAAQGRTPDPRSP